MRNIKGSIRRKNSRKSFPGKVIAFITIVAAILAVVIVVSKGINTNASEKHIGDKYYVSITVSGGDTLWSIATENMEVSAYSDVRDYIEEIKCINGLESDSITSGQHLIIARYQSN